MSGTCSEHPEKERTAFCVGCGKAMCGECVVKRAGRPLCASCADERATAPQPQTAEPAPARAPSAPRGAMLDRAQQAAPRKKVFADTGALNVPKQDIVGKPGIMDVIWGREPRRIVAKLIDASIVVLPSFPLSIGVHLLTARLFREISGLGIRLSLYITLVFVSTFYFIYCEWKYGKTIGKHIVGLRVVRKDGTPGITFFQSMWRWTGFLAASVWSLTGWWIASRISFWTFSAFKLTKADVPKYLPPLVLFSSITVFTLFSLGLLITFVGKYKRGYHDLLGETAVGIVNK